MIFNWFSSDFQLIDGKLIVIIDKKLVFIAVVNYGHCPYHALSQIFWESVRLSIFINFWKIEFYTFLDISKVLYVVLVFFEIPTLFPNLSPLVLQHNRLYLSWGNKNFVENFGNVIAQSRNTCLVYNKLV